MFGFIDGRICQDDSHGSILRIRRISFGLVGSTSIFVFACFSIGCVSSVSWFCSNWLACAPLSTSRHFKLLESWCFRGCSGEEASLDIETTKEIRLGVLSDPHDAILMGMRSIRNGLGVKVVIHVTNFVGVLPLQSFYLPSL